MGFGYVVIKMPDCMSIAFLMKQLSRFKLLIMMAITHLGLLKSVPEEASHQSPENPTSYLILTDGPNPSIVIVSAHALTSLIKKKLPVVEYGCFLERFGAPEEAKLIDHDHDHSECAVCLDSIEKGQEIRELSNCCHIFHRECLDRWVDESQITCPLCRSTLISIKGEWDLCTTENS